MWNFEFWLTFVWELCYIVTLLAGSLPSCGQFLAWVLSMAIYTAWKTCLVLQAFKFCTSDGAVEFAWDSWFPLGLSLRAQSWVWWLNQTGKIIFLIICIGGDTHLVLCLFGLTLLLGFLGLWIGQLRGFCGLRGGWHKIWGGFFLSKFFNGIWVFLLLLILPVTALLRFHCEPIRLGHKALVRRSIEADLRNMEAEELPHVGSHAERLFVKPLGHFVHIFNRGFVFQVNWGGSILLLELTSCQVCLLYFILDCHGLTFLQQSTLRGNDIGSAAHIPFVNWERRPQIVQFVHHSGVLNQRKTN